MSILTAFLLQVASVVLTFVTGIMGAAPVLLQYKVSPRKIIYAFNLLTIGGLIHFGMDVIAIVVLSHLVLVETYLRTFKQTFYKRTSLSVTLSTLFFLAGFWAYCSLYLNQSLATVLIKFLEEGLSRAPELKEQIPITPNQIIWQAPSIIFCFFSLSLWMSVLFERRSGVSFIDNRITKNLHNFRNPDYLIWAVIFSLFFSFVKTPIAGLQELALNLLNVTLLLYFFQGISTLSFILNSIKINSFIRVLAYVIFVLQVMLPICMGILDFWLNFRAKISKKSDVV